MNIFYGQFSVQANPKSFERNIEIALLPTCSALSLYAKPRAEDPSLPSERTAGMGRDPSPWKLPAIPGSPEGKRNIESGPATWPGPRAMENFPSQCLAEQSPTHRQGKLCLITLRLPWKNALFWAGECLGGFYRARKYRDEFVHLTGPVAWDVFTKVRLGKTIWKHQPRNTICHLFLLYGKMSNKEKITNNFNYNTLFF